ncbi:MAG: LptF/LptG family permease [Cyanobacteria bacterium P01_H01_bin.74]
MAAQILPLFRLVDGYLLRQLIPVIGFAVALFTIVWLAPETLFKLTQHVFSQKISVAQGIVLFLYHLPKVLQQTIPLSVLLATIVVFQKLSQQYELIAMMASGIGFRRILRAVLYVGILFGLLHMAINEVLIPYAQPRLEKAKIALDLDTADDQNFLFIEKNRHKQLDKLFLIGQIREDPLKNFIILYYTETPKQGVQISRILRAETGFWVAKQKRWFLKDGIEYVLNTEGVYKDIRRFDWQFVHTSRYAAKLLNASRESPLAMPFGSLQRYIKLLKAGGQYQDVPFFEVQLWQKITGPLATVIFALLGCILGIERLRTNRFFGLTFGALVVFLYSIMVPITANFGALAILPSFALAWLPLIFCVTMTILLQKFRPKQG